ncbi:MAG: hypothetical protein QW735_00785 [archaeon]
MDRILLLLIVALIIAFWLQVYIAAFLLFLSVLIAVWPKKQYKKTEKKEKEDEETILHPVIYEDIGEPPYLYPKKGKIEIITKWPKHGSTFMLAGESLGKVSGSIIKLFKKIFD